MATTFVQEGVPLRSRADTAKPSKGPDAPELVAAEAPPAAAIGARKIFTWRNAIMGGVLAFAFLGVVVTGYMTMRVMGIGPVGSLVAAGVLEERERIILAEFGSQTGDTLLAAAATEAFRIDLAQSPLVTLVDPAHVSQVLRRMEREASEKLDLDLAREVAIRDGLQVLIAGEVNGAGRGFFLTVQLLSAESGAVLAGYRETARDSADIIGAVDRLSKKLRERMGESLKTIRSNEPLLEVTTSSLVALRKYSQAVRAIGSEGESDKGIALLEEALALDPTFAMAWRKLGAESNNRGERERAVQAIRQAFAYRDRLTDRERYLTIANYHGLVTGEVDREITALRTLLDTYPDDHWALVILGRAYTDRGEYARAEELNLRAAEAAPYSLYGYWNAVIPQVTQGKFDAAEATLVRYEQNVGGPNVGYLRLQLAAARRDYESAESWARELLEEQDDIGGRVFAIGQLANVARIRGQLAAAEGHLLRAMSDVEEIDRADRYLRLAANLAMTAVVFRGARVDGLEIIESALTRHSLESIPPLERPYLELAQVYAYAGQPEQARAYLGEYDVAIEESLRRMREGNYRSALGTIALAERRNEDAIREYRSSDTHRPIGGSSMCPWCTYPELARAFELAGVPDSAISYYERYVDATWFGQLYRDSYELGAAYERLGILNEGRADVDKAVYYYGKLVDLWADADLELQPRVDAARRAIQSLSADR